MENKKMKCGIYDNLDINEYHRDESISSTGINLILDCPKRYYYEYYEKNRILGEKELLKQAEKYKLGRAVHMLVLEPKKFDDTFYCMTESVHLATKVGKEIYAKAEIEAAGREILRTGEWEDIKDMADAILKHHIWAELKNGKVEQSIFWKGGTYDTPLRARPDVFTDRFIVDIKTTESIKTFSKSIYQYGYHRQAAMQIDALKQLDGKQRFFAFFVVEKKAPYLTAGFTLDDRSIIQGRNEYLQGAAIYTECSALKEWNGYEEQFQLLSLPNWAITEEQPQESLKCLMQ